jgi:hypothetical protein
MHDDGREIACVIDMHVRDEDVFERREIEAAASDALERAPARVDEDPRRPIDGDDVPGRGATSVRNRAAATQNGYRESGFRR